MKRKRVQKLFMAYGLALGIALCPAPGLEVQAAEAFATVEGTVLSGTTSELLLLSTREGRMEIKLDGDTDASACKILLPGRAVSVFVAHGSDEYLHAVKITSEKKTPGTTLDASSSATVIGTINDKTKDDILFVNTAQGEMEIKLDAATNMSGCSVLVAGQTYSITCVRGSDAYMHATSISDGVTAGASAFASNVSPAPAGQVTASTMSVSGTVADRTRENLLYLSTAEGEMQIVIDANTDARNGMVITPGRKLTVSVYHGNDEYLHAASITGVKDSGVVEVNTSDTSTVTGTVGSKSTENLLYLKTPQGEMELKLDTVRNVSNCKVITSGRKLSITCARGSDAYMHAVDITGV